MSVAIDLSGRTALVTGASRGIGRAIALGLARAGADVVGIGTRIEANDDGLGAEVAACGRRFTPLSCDLSDRAAIRALDARTQALGLSVDILINNAGIIRRSTPAAHADEDWDAVMAVNLDAAFLLARAFGGPMVARGGGRIVFIASVLAFQGGRNVPGYAASKGAVANLARALASDWAGWGVGVNAVAPGYVETDNTAALRDDPAREAELIARVPAGRWGRPEDIIGPVLFLASDLAGFVHGAVLPVDGGWLAR
jgi:2-deoxy-D-gluconate 3-dehydrogenase